MARRQQVCSVEPCSGIAVWTTTRKPAYCREHVDEIWKQGGVAALEEFKKPTDWTLIRCNTCGTETHVRFSYALDRVENSLTACGVCDYYCWYERSLELGSIQVPSEDSSAKQFAEDGGYDFLNMIENPVVPFTRLMRIQCKHCGRITAKPVSNVRWGCTCRQSSGVVTSRRSSGGRKRVLFKDSGFVGVDWWDHESNTQKDWETSTSQARRKVNWVCPECGYRFEESIRFLATNSPRCARCLHLRHLEEKKKFAKYEGRTIADIPDLLAAWHSEDYRNYGLDPKAISASGNDRIVFLCPHGHKARMSPYWFLRKGCSTCRALATRKANKQYELENPERTRISEEVDELWHPTKNEVSTIKATTGRNYSSASWRAPECCHEWSTLEYPTWLEDRTQFRCPVCESLRGSLAYVYPQIADEWSGKNPIDPWHIRPTTNINFLPKWVCLTNPDHVWEAPLSSRVSGAQCPECRQSGKSLIELQYFEAANDKFGNAHSGFTLSSDQFMHRNTWSIDVFVDLKDSYSLALEYDGGYWHRDKIDTDLDKTKDLLSAGLLVVRLREDDLDFLPLEHPQLLQLRVFSQATAPEDILAKIQKWIRQTRMPQPD